MSENIPVSKEEALLLAQLERTLTEAELQSLRQALSEDPSLAGEARLITLLENLRLEQRIAQNEDAAWLKFRDLAHQHKRSSSVVSGQAQSRSRWFSWLGQWFSPMRAAMPVLAAFVIIAQSGGLVWLYNKPVSQIEPQTDTRGGGTAQCPAILVRLKPSATTGDLTRILTQGQMQVVAGPDASGYYRIVGQTNIQEEGSILLRDLATDIKVAGDCSVRNK